MDLIKLLTEEFSLKAFQVENTVKLLDEGNTIPFIARYRKELTGSLDDQVLRELSERLDYLRSLEKKKEEVRAHIEELGALTEEISAALAAAVTLAEVDDIYRPYRPKRKTRASVARERGLQPLADAIFAQSAERLDLDTLLAEYVNPELGVETTEDALAGALDIIAETVSDNAEIRKELRDLYRSAGIIRSKAAKEEDSVYAGYYDYTEPVSKIVPHRILAIDRGEREEFLKVSLEVPEDGALRIVRRDVNPASPQAGLVQQAADDAWSRLIAPSVEREIRSELTQKAADSAIRVFALNLRQLLMQPPIRGHRVLGLDPAYRTGCKVAVVDETGRVLDTGVVYPTPPHNKKEEAKAKLTALIKKHGITVIAIGNGTASKETEIFTAELISELADGGPHISYLVVSEAGASVYSASKLGAEEFPDFDVSLRSAVSIARRLQDPLAELVKIDPKAIGVGQYQHDMPQKQLSDTLSGVVESCVNTVGVDLNTASPSLLAQVSGIGGALAKNIVAYREENGRFESRTQLKKVPKLGPKAFEQCAGFLRIPGGKHVLDNTAVHPESYQAAKALLKLCGYTEADVAKGNLSGLSERVAQYGEEKAAAETGVGVPTLRDIIKELQQPGLDPRDELPKPVLRTDVLDIADLSPGMELTGTVRNVIDFGAFVDIGVHQDGLVHISQLADRFVRHPSDVVKVGDIVKVRVLSVDVEKKRISLTMKQA